MCQPWHFVVLAALYQKKTIAWRDLQNWKGHAQNMLLCLVLDQCPKSAEAVGTTADVLREHGCRKEANMLKCKFSLCLCAMWIILQYGSNCCNWCLVTTFADTTDVQ